MKEKKYKFPITLLLVFLPIIIFVYNTDPVGAAVGQASLDQAGQVAGFIADPANKSGVEVSVVVTNMINGLLSILAVVFTYLIIIAGFNWMTSGGNAEKVLAAKTSFKNALMGLLLVVTSYILAQYVMEALAASTGLTA